MQFTSKLFKKYFKVQIQGSVQVPKNLESHGILFFSFPGLESHGILCRVMESHGKLNHYKNYESITLLGIMIEKHFTEYNFTEL